MTDYIYVTYYWKGFENGEKKVSKILSAHTLTKRDETNSKFKADFHHLVSRRPNATKREIALMKKYDWKKIQEEFPEMISELEELELSEGVWYQTFCPGFSGNWEKK